MTLESTLECLFIAYENEDGILAIARWSEDYLPDDSVPRLELTHIAGRTTFFATFFLSLPLNIPAATEIITSNLWEIIEHHIDVEAAEAHRAMWEQVFGSTDSAAPTDADT